MVSQVAVLPLIAQYLTVEEFGAVALAMTVVVFAQLLSDAGIGRSLIREQSYEQSEWNTVFWFLVLVGAVLMGLLLLGAPLAARMFDTPITGPLISALSVVPLFYSLAAVPSARMERDAQFPQLAVIQLASAIVGLVAAVGLAVAGAGAWALIAQQVALALVRFGLTMILSPFSVGAPKGFVNIINHIKFGRDSIGVAFLFTSQRQVPVMLIGYFLGQAPLGLYAMSQRFLNLPQMALSGPFSQTAYQRMTKLQDTPGQMAEVFIMVIRLLAFLVFPPMLLLAAVASDVFASVLSEPWREAGTIFTIAAFGIALECVTSTAGPMFQAADKSFLRLKMATERTILRILAVAAAIPFGVVGVALSLTVFPILYLPRYLSYANRADPFSKRAAITAMLPALGVSLATTLALYIWTQSQDPSNGWILLAQTCGMLVLAWGILLGLQFRTLKKGLSILGG